MLVCRFTIFFYVLNEVITTTKVLIKILNTDYIIVKLFKIMFLLTISALPFKGIF